MASNINASIAADRNTTGVPRLNPQPRTTGADSYVKWLRETKQPLFEVDGTFWRPYQKALVPASLVPRPVALTTDQAHELLDRSGALMLRYFTRTYDTPTSFWYTACNDYSFDSLDGKIRYQIRRAYKHCRIERVDPVWLADHGYPCYLAAYSRYRNAQPESPAMFDRMCRGAADGPFEFWAAFAGDELAGFGKYFVGEDYVAGTVLKFDPRFYELRLGTAFQDGVLNHYVRGQGKAVVIGFRSLVHDTQIHEFVLKFGYQRVYCDLKLVYRPLMRAGVNLLYPFRSLLERVPQSSTATNLRALLAQEEIQRSFG